MLIGVEAVGMASCLGPAVPACAAFRASLFRPVLSPDVTAAAPGEEQPRPVVVGALPVATFGFSGVGRWVALACELLKDLWSRVDLEALGPETGFFLALPDPWEQGMEAEGPDAARRVDVLGARVLEQSFKNVGLRWGGPLRFFAGGNEAFARALHEAKAALTSRRLKSCIAAGLDSLVERATLEALAEDGRLKTPDNPVGLMPGEAGAALLLSAGVSRLPEGSGRVLLRAVALGEEPQPRDSGMPSDGRALATCALAALETAEARKARPVLVSDHNGEVYRAREYGLLLHHLRAAGPELDGLTPWFPATGFGDTGAASGAVGACVAVRALQRGYAPSRVCVVLSSAEATGRAAVVLGAEPPVRAR